MDTSIEWTIITALIGAIVYLQYSGRLPGDAQIRIRILFFLLCAFLIVSNFILMIMDLVRWAQSF